MTLIRTWAIIVFCIAVSPTDAATLYVSPVGDDANAGSQQAPLKTISAAAALAEPGDVILVGEGVYRERVAPARGGEPGKPITYRAEPGKRVIVKGSEVWQPEWQSHGYGIYSAVPEDRLFNDRSPEYVDHYNPLKVELASTPWNRAGKREVERGYDGDEALTYTCGQVFVDGRPYTEVPFQAELVPGTWLYNADSGEVFIHLGKRVPGDCLVELTTRRRIFAPHVRGLGHIVVEGFIFEHCGNQYPTNFWNTAANAQKGAVGTEAGHNWIIHRNVVRYAKTFAIDVGTVDSNNDASQACDNRVEENYVIDNGSAGILSNGSLRLAIRNNVVMRNNRLRFLGPKRWEQAGIKCHAFRDGVIEHNYIAHNYDTYGIWLDNQFPHSRISKNLVYKNGRAGIFLEMSDYDFDTLLVDQNLVLSNAENAVYIHDASGATFVNNLFANTEDAADYGQAVYIRQVSARTKTGHHTFHDNLFIGNARNVEVNYPAARSGIQRFDRNLYGVAVHSQSFAVNRNSDVPSPWTTSEFYKLVRSQLGDGTTAGGVWQNAERAALTYGQWREFWQSHGVENDFYSKFDPASTVTYDAETHLMTVHIDKELPNGASQRHSAGGDYLGRSWPRDGAIPPGPFADLARGEHPYTVWDGLEVVDDLPPEEWTEKLNTAQ